MYSSETTTKKKGVKLTAHYTHKADFSRRKLCRQKCQNQTQQDLWPPLSIGKQPVRCTGRHINPSALGLFTWAGIIQGKNPKRPTGKWMFFVWIAANVLYLHLKERQILRGEHLQSTWDSDGYRWISVKERERALLWVCGRVCVCVGEAFYSFLTSFTGQEYADLCARVCVR